MLRHKKTVSGLLALVMTLMTAAAFIPVYTYADAAAPGITVYVSISNAGVIAKTKDGDAMAWKKVTASDIDGDGHITYHEALYCAHEQYYEGGAEAGYDAGTSDYGFGINTLWGVTTSWQGQWTNNTFNMSGAADVTVSKGDHLYAYTYAADENWNSLYNFSYFDKYTAKAETGEAVTLNLKGAAYDDSWNLVTGAAGGADIGYWADGTFVSLDQKTDDLGNASITFDTAGTYVVTASGTYDNAEIIQPVCIVTVTKESNPLSLEGKTVTLRYSKLKKKALNVERSSAISVTNDADSVLTYSLMSAKKGSKSFKKYFKVNSDTGRITVKKKISKGTYKVKVRVTASETDKYGSTAKTVTFRIKVR